MSCGKPVLFGQSTFNFQAACDWALMAGAAKQLNTAEEVVQTACDWLHHPHLSEPIAQSARDFVAQHHGASAKMAHEIHQIITKNSKRPRDKLKWTNFVFRQPDKPSIL